MTIKQHCAHLDLRSHLFVILVVTQYTTSGKNGQTKTISCGIFSAPEIYKKGVHYLKNINFLATMYLLVNQPPLFIRNVIAKYILK